jgi:hypothetical protein
MLRREKVYAAWRPHGSRADSRQLGKPSDRLVKIWVSPLNLEVHHKHLR